MINVNLNYKMFKTMISGKADILSDIPIPMGLKELLDEGFAQFRGATFYNFASDNLVTEGNDFEDIFYVEKNENKLYLNEDITSTDPKLAYKQALFFSIKLLEKLQLVEGDFEVHLSFTDPSVDLYSYFCTATDYSMRKNENLNSFKNESVIRLYTNKKMLDS